MQPKEINAYLVNSGHKLTAPRKRIASWIAGNKGIFSASEILNTLTDLDKVSIYRTLELFCTLDIIHTVASLHGEQHFELHDKQKHHHHIVCTRCEKNECTPCDMPKKDFSSFKNVHHSILFTGLCKPCAQ